MATPNSSTHKPPFPHLSSSPKTATAPKIPATPHTLINRTLMAAIIATISQPLQPLVLRKETVAEIWTTLKALLQPQTRSRLIQLKAELHSLSMHGTNLTQYLTRVKSIHDQLEAAGCHSDDEDMNGLLNSFNGFTTVFHLKSERIDLPTFFSLLSTEALNLQHRTQTPSPDPHLALATTLAVHLPPPTATPTTKAKTPAPTTPTPTPPNPTTKANPKTDPP